MKTNLHTKTFTQMFKAALFIRAKKWKQPKCPSTDEGINEMWYIHAMEYYLAIKGNETLISATTWMSLVNMMLTKAARYKRPRIIYEMPQIGKSTETESTLVVARGSEEGKCGVTANWHGLSF